MTIELRQEQEHQISQALQSGAYRTPEDVIDRALEVLHEQDEFLWANREAIEQQIRRGIDELDRGEGIPENELDSYLHRLRAQEE